MWSSFIADPWLRLTQHSTVPRRHTALSFRLILNAMRPETKTQHHQNLYEKRTEKKKEETTTAVCQLSAACMAQEKRVERKLYTFYVASCVKRRNIPPRSGALVPKDWNRDVQQFISSLLLRFIGKRKMCVCVCSLVRLRIRHWIHIDRFHIRKMMVKTN